jgi:large subunit ribosomal protein L22
VAVAENTRTTVRAEARYVRATPRKAQLVAEQIRGLTVPEARALLAFMTRDAARDVRKVLDSAVANAEANHGLVGDELTVHAAYAGAGPVLKRWRARARGRVGRIKKRTCHITVVLALPTGEEIPAPREHVPAAPPPPAPLPEPEEQQAEEPAAEEPAGEAAEAEAEEKPARKRAPRKKAEEKAEPEAEEKPEPKPRKRTAKPKAEAAEKPTAEKPKAPAKPKTTRKKTTTETEGGEG